MFRLQLYGRGLHQYLADPNAAGAMARSFLNWAQNGELLDIDFLDNNQGVRLDMWYDILAYMLAWEAIKDTVPLTEIEYAQIDDWLNAVRR